jgi:hypothetical protein
MAEGTTFTMIPRIEASDQNSLSVLSFHVLMLTDAESILLRMTSSWAIIRKLAPAEPTARSKRFCFAPPGNATCTILTITKCSEIQINHDRIKTRICEERSRLYNDYRRLPRWKNRKRQMQRKSHVATNFQYSRRLGPQRLIHEN